MFYCADNLYYIKRHNGSSSETITNSVDESDSVKVAVVCQVTQSTFRIFKMCDDKNNFLVSMK